MADITRDFVRTAGKHFVSLSCVQRATGEDKSQILVFSGFVIDVLGEWLYVTAGHILRDIRTALASGSSFDIWRLGDQTAGNLFNNTAIPYAFDESVWLVVEDEGTGLDYAAVHLSWLDRRQLEAGGVTAIAKNAWSDHVTEYDHWALIGIPSESVDYDGTSEIKARLVLTPLVPAEEPALAGIKALNQFFAHPVAGSEKYVKDADGLSGGPVFTLKKVEGRWLYSVIGVQSGWYPNSKSLAICPFSTFALEVELIVAEALNEGGQSEPAGAA